VTETLRKLCYLTNAHCMYTHLYTVTSGLMYHKYGTSYSTRGYIAICSVHTIPSWYAHRRHPDNAGSENSSITSDISARTLRNRSNTCRSALVNNDNKYRKILFRFFPSSVLHTTYICIDIGTQWRGEDKRVNVLELDSCYGRTFDIDSIMSILF